MPPTVPAPPEAAPAKPPLTAAALWHQEQLRQQQAEQQSMIKEQAHRRWQLQHKLMQQQLQAERAAAAADATSPSSVPRPAVYTPRSEAGSAEAGEGPAKATLEGPAGATAVLATVVSSALCPTAEAHHPSSLPSPFAPRSDLELRPSAAGQLAQSMPRRPMAENNLWFQPIWAQLDNIEAGRLPGITLNAPPQVLEFTPNVLTKCKSPDNEA